MRRRAALESSSLSAAPGTVAALCEASKALDLTVIVAALVVLNTQPPIQLEIGSRKCGVGPAASSRRFLREPNARGSGGDSTRGRVEPGV